MAGFDWRLQIAQSPGGWIELAEPVKAKPKAPPVPAPRKLNKRGTNRKKPWRYPAEVRAEIADAYIEGNESVRAIAARYGISPPTVLNYAKGVER